MSEEEMIKIINEITITDLLNCWDSGEKEYKAIKSLLDSYTNLKQIEQEHQKINRELREEIDIQIEHNKEIDNMNKILANTIRGDSIIINDSISKDKIKEIKKKADKDKCYQYLVFYGEINDLLKE